MITGLGFLEIRSGVIIIITCALITFTLIVSDYLICF